MSQGDEPKKKDAPRWAADEPTAMWDGSSLEDQGLDASRKPAAPAAPPTAQAATPQRAGLSWPLTIGIAIAVAVAVYFVVRALRG